MRVTAVARRSGGVFSAEAKPPVGERRLSRVSLMWGALEAPGLIKSWAASREVERVFVFGV